MKNKIQPSVLLILLSVSFSLFGQTKTNYEKIDELLNISVNEINLEQNKEYKLLFSAAEDYKILESSLISHLSNKEIELTLDSVEAEIINYNIHEVKTDYSNIFKDGFFGEYLVKRNFRIKGSYYFTDSQRTMNVTEFDYELSDSIFYSDISKVENLAYSFTTAPVPDEPFFASTLEPVIAIGTAAVAVYLFFNIRSR